MVQVNLIRCFGNQSGLFVTYIYTLKIIFCDLKCLHYLLLCNLHFIRFICIRHISYTMQKSNKRYNIITKVGIIVFTKILETTGINV